MLDGLRLKLGERVDGASLAFLRASLGALMLYKAWALLFGGELEAHYIGPEAGWLAPYPGFAWLQDVPHAWLRPAAWALGCASLLLTLGLLTRVAALATCLLWSLFWLQDATHWNNHFYLYSLLTGLLACTPATRRSAPLYGVALLRGQLFALYFFGGVAKLNTEWMLHAEPMASVLRGDVARSAFASLGADAVAFTQSTGFAYFMAWSGAAFDLLAGFGLLWRRTRALTFCLTLAFHAMNHALLFDDIGTFPLLGVLSATIFFEPGWPRDLAARLGIRRASRAAPMTTATAISPTAVAAIAAFALYQIAMPLRHYAIPGPVNWTLEGARYAWRMKAVGKAVGPFAMHIDDPALPADARAQLPALLDISTGPPHWAALPKRLIAVEPYVGARGIYNPLGTGPAPAVIRCDDPGWIFDALGAVAAAGEAGSPRAAQRVERMRELWSTPQGARNALAFRTHLAALADDPALAERTRAALALAPPFFVHGWSGAVELGCSAQRAEDSVVVARLDDYPFEFGGLLPLVFRSVDTTGAEAIRWNADHELGLRGRRAVQAWPGILHAYVQHAAASWERRFGTRPRIRIDDFVALRPYGLQPQVDANADLVGARLPWLGHADWIAPLIRDAAKPAAGPGRKGATAVAPRDVRAPAP